jgi:hypothetical protein
MKSKKLLKTSLKYFRMLATPFQHIFQNFFRITAEGDNRITAEGDTRITADSDY